MDSKKIKQIYENIPVGYYEKSIKENLLQRFWHSRRFKAVTDLLKEEPPSSPVLDVGCSDGTFSEVIFRALGGKKRIEMVGIDFSSKAISYAKKRHPQIKFKVVDCYHLPFKKRSFGAIFSLEVLEHLYHPLAAVKQMRRCLKDGGYVIILVPNENFLFRFVWFWVTKFKGRIWKDAHIHQFHLKELTDLCQKAGFEIVKIRYLLLRMLLLVKAKPKNLPNYDWAFVADHFVGPETLFHRCRQKIILDLLEKERKGKKYLDAGCHTGLILCHLPPGSVGLDINQKILRKAQEYGPLSKLVLGDIQKMPFKKNSFDIVICADLLEHLLDPTQAVKEIKRVLKNGGKLIGSVPRESLVWKLQKLSRTGPKVPYHKHFRSEEELRDLLKEFRGLKLTKGCFGLEYFFVAQKDLPSDEKNDH